MAQDYCQISPSKDMAKESQAHPCLEPQQDPCVPAHNELICHTMGERRHHYLKEVKKILDKLDSKECPTKASLDAAFGGVDGGTKGSNDRPMIKYPGYLDTDSPKYKRPFYVPTITSLPIKEIRPTSEISRHKYEESPILHYVPVNEIANCPQWALKRKKSFELRGGILYKGCDCDKHNGLQDKCERTDCYGDEACLTKPTANCLPSQGFVPPPPQRPKNDMVREAVGMQQSSGSKTYCCCPVVSPFKDKTIDGKTYKDCNHANGPGKFDCYKCRQ